jgi:hypothetical protein
MSIDLSGEARRNIHQTRICRDADTERNQVRCKRGAAGRERDLRQKPKRMEERRICGCGPQGVLGSFCCATRDYGEVGPGLQFVNDLLPLL